ncbi:MAG: DUF3078 domain-containing protein [Melioribacteraceae bacterium]|nr:DUF3078 domain-containing protein [Melioribacteraceae bacterium]
MKKYLLIIFLTLSISILAQDDKPKDGWVNSGVVGLNANQISLSNWSQGGDNTFSWTIFGKFEAVYTKAPITLKNNLKLSFGKTKIGDADFITNDNEIYLENVLGYDVDWEVTPFFSNTFRSVLGPGYDYSSSPKIKTSAILDPGYLTQSFGLMYDKLAGFSTRLGFALQEVITSDFKHYADDPDTHDEVESFKFETGIESVTKAKYTFKENIQLESQLRLFTRFEEIDVVDVRWDNTVTAKISDLFNVNLNVLLIYEKQQSLKTQVKEALQFGISYTLF